MSAALDHQSITGGDASAEGGRMSETTFLTPEEVAERYRGSVSVGTLRNWRAMKIGKRDLTTAYRNAFGVG